MVLDFHTHCLQAEHAIINADACRFFPQAGKCYSVGVHPWLAEQDAAAQWERVQALAAHPQVVAIGETGLDSLRGAPLAAQMLLFEHHIALANQVGKPLVVHMVRTSQQVLQVWRRCQHHVPCAIHGFRGKPEQAKQLMAKGMRISLGHQYNIDTLRYLFTCGCPFYLETDDCHLPIEEIYRQASIRLGVDVCRLVSRCNPFVDLFRPVTS